MSSNHVLIWFNFGIIIIELQSPGCLCLFQILSWRTSLRYQHTTSSDAGSDELWKSTTSSYIGIGSIGRAPGVPNRIESPTNPQIYISKSHGTATGADYPNCSPITTPPQPPFLACERASYTQFAGFACHCLHDAHQVCCV